MPRRFPIIQFPNRTLILGMLAGLVAQASHGETRRAAGILSRLVMLVWSAGEIRHGANWLRRLLGLVVATRHVRGLMRSL
jgi:hypothetical protein